MQAACICACPCAGVTPQTLPVPALAHAGSAECRPCEPGFYNPELGASKVCTLCATAGQAEVVPACCAWLGDMGLQLP